MDDPTAPPTPEQVREFMAKDGPPQERRERELDVLRRELGWDLVEQERVEREHRRKCGM